MRPELEPETTDQTVELLQSAATLICSLVTDVP